MHRLDASFLAWQGRARSYALLYRFTLAIRVLLAAGFIPTGMVKVLGRRFTTLSPEYPVGAFFETLYQSGYFWQFIGWAQVIAGTCLIVPATATVGALLFLPILASIFVITLSYDFAFTPGVTGFMLLANVYLVCWDYDRLRGILGLDVTGSETRPPSPHLGRMERVVYIVGAGSALSFTLIDRLRLLPPTLSLWALLAGILSACVAMGYAWTIRFHRVEAEAPQKLLLRGRDRHQSLLEGHEWDD